MARLAWIRWVAVAVIACGCGGRSVWIDESTGGAPAAGASGTGAGGKGIGVGGASGGSFGSGSGGVGIAGTTGTGATGGYGGVGGFAGGPRGSFERGMNLGNRLDAPNEGDWGPVLRESDFPAIASKGFDHIRLPVRFNAHAELAPPYRLDEQFMKRVDWAIERALSSGLSIVIDFHHYEELHTMPDAHAPRFLGIWEQLAARYQLLPPSVAFELLNEPNNALDGRWNELLAQAIKVVRQTNPTRILIVDGPFWAGPSSLAGLVLPPDPNVVASIHSYDPVLFTLQGAEFGGPIFSTTGVVYPGPPAVPIVPKSDALAEPWVADWFQRYNTLPGDLNPSSPAQVAREIGHAAAYTLATGIPVYNGEWGCTEKADFASRLRWIRDVRRETENQGLWGWAIWDDGGGISLYDSETGEWNEDILQALMN